MPARRRETRLERDVRLELEHHVAASTDYLIQQGVPADTARIEAIRRLGSLDEAHRRLYPYARDREARMRLREAIGSIVQDVRYAARTFARERGFTALMVLTLGLGIGVNAAMFGILDRLLFRGPDHVRDASRVMRIYYTGGRPGSQPSTFSANNYAAYTGFAEHTRSFAGLAAYWGMQSNLGEGLNVERVNVQSATWSLFPVLGVQPAVGRFFDATEDTPPAGQPVAVLSHGLWSRLFAGDPAAVGRRIVLDGKSFTVIGVAPPGFTGPELGRVDVWTPHSSGTSQPRSDWPTTWNARWLHVIARLKAGVSAEAAGADATAAYAGFYAGRAAFARDYKVSLLPLRYNDTGAEPMEATVAKWVSGVALVVLLVACANVANLLLVRSIRRRREIAVRTALGVTGVRLGRLLGAEILVLVGAGTAAGLITAYWAAHFMRSVLLPDVAWDGAPLDRRVLLFTAGAAAVTALLVGFVPLVQTMRLRLTDTLRDGAPQGGRTRARLRQALSIAQAGLSVVLLIGAGLFVQSLGRIQSLDLGIQPDRVLSVWLQWPTITLLPPEQRDAERARRRQVIDETLVRLRMQRGVEAASLAIGVPLQTMFGLDVRVPGVSELPMLPGGGPYVSAVGANYFRTVGTDLLRGRDFADADGAGTERVAIINDTMARTLWPAANALGECVLVEKNPCARIVGVVEDARRFALREEPAMQLYVPRGQETSISGTTLLVRPTPDDGVGAGTLRRELFARDPSLAYVIVTALQDQIDPQVRPWRLGAAMFLSFGILAFVIAAIGLYSVIAYTTAQRTHEIGVRVALGARPADVLRMIVLSAVGIAVIGIGAGVLVALAAGSRIEPLLFDTSARSPVVFAVVIAVLLVTAFLAGLIPGRRATRVDPVIALRS